MTMALFIGGTSVPRWDLRRPCSLDHAWRFGQEVFANFIGVRQCACRCARSSTGHSAFEEAWQDRLGLGYGNVDTHSTSSYISASPARAGTEKAPLALVRRGLLTCVHRHVAVITMYAANP